jgi:hypothetical protein
MTKPRDKNYGLIIFYGVSFLLAIITGTIYGFTDSHTPPIPFAIEIVVMLIGFIWLVINTVSINLQRKDSYYRKLTVHITGMVFNGLVLFKCLFG